MELKVVGGTDVAVSGLHEPQRGADAPAPLVRWIGSPGGRLRRWFVHGLLRVTARNASVDVGDVPALRRHQDAVDRRLGRVDPALRRVDVTLGGVPVERVEAPESRPDRTLFYIHGGAFCLRMPNLHAALAGRWARRLGACALLVDYRLAPEHPYPAALDDCVAAYRGLVAQGVDPRSIVLAGDSAGGNLALALLHRLKAANGPMPRCAVLLSPVVDFTLSSPSIVSNAARDPMFTIERLAALRGLYARPEQFLDPTVSPLFGDFAGFPPLLFQAGGIEMLRDDSTRAAQRAQAAGVSVEVQIWRDMAHVFHALPLPQAAAAEQYVLDFIAKHAGWLPAARVDSH